MVSKGLITLFFEAAFIRRWNDHVCPVILTELDKQAHKVLIAYVLAKFEQTQRQKPINWIDLIEGAMFEFLHRVTLTDIKPQIFHRMMRQKGPQLNAWVLEKIHTDMFEDHPDLFERFKRYFMDSPYSIEKKILQASHYLATQWEFKLLYPYNQFKYAIEKTREEIDDEIEDHMDLLGVQKILLGKKTARLIGFCGELRFQKRWTMSPQLPETSVLGHMLIVSMLSYLCALEIDVNDDRRKNIYYGGFFHDLPEVLTRDIISPVKTSVEGLRNIIVDMEDKMLEDQIMPLIPAAWQQEILHYIHFKDTSSDSHKTSCQSITEKQSIDAQLIDACDHFSAYIEAAVSYKHGITSRHLEEARKTLYQKYRHQVIGNIHFGQMFDYFS
ncbi:MAG: HD domain-containing protein [Candidatus Magnetomorum sp.]|nr:HD domain-containing protein [Candidatus Magnetomorum sp.]